MIARNKSIRKISLVDTSFAGLFFFEREREREREPHWRKKTFSNILQIEKNVLSFLRVVQYGLHFGKIKRTFANLVYLPYVQNAII